MCKRQDVSRSYSLVTSGKGGSASVYRDVDRLDLPPLIGLGTHTLVILKFIFNEHSSSRETILFRKDEVPDTHLVVIGFYGSDDLPPPPISVDKPKCHTL